MLYKAKFILNKKCLRELYFAFIHSYLSLGWAITNPYKHRELYNNKKYTSNLDFYAKQKNNLNQSPKLFSQIFSHQRFCSNQQSKSNLLLLKRNKLFLISF